jgi:hypothetical protein
MLENTLNIGIAPKHLSPSCTYLTYSLGISFVILEACGNEYEIELQSSGLDCSLTYNSCIFLALPLKRKTREMVLKIFKIVDLESGGFSFMCVKSNNLSRDAKCEVLTAVLLYIQFFWDVMLCH